LREQLLPVVSTIPGINLEELAAVDFDGRIDTKYIFPAHRLVEFLNRIKEHVVILELKGKYLFDYKNMYFDTEHHEYFRQHHAGYLNRVKVRARSYSEKGPFVFEIKTKSNKSLTIKERISLESFDSIENEETNAFLMEKLGYGFEKLPCKTGIDYQRMTFANRDMTEKFTLDINLTGILGNEKHLFQNLAIAEVKQPRFTYNSVFVRTLKEMQIAPHSFSKYCASVMQFQENLKRNRFKPTLTKLKKIKKENGIIA